MERNNHLMRGSMCCCCGAVLPSPFFIRIGNFRRVCVQCGNEIVSALKYRKDLFDNKLPVLAVVETPNGFERMVHG